MQFIKRIKYALLSITLIASCLTFQTETSVTKATTQVTWISNNTSTVSADDIYQIKLRKTESINRNPFSIFKFKCFLKHRKNVLASVLKQQQSLHLPQHSDYLKATTQQLNSEDNGHIS